MVISLQEAIAEEHSKAQTLKIVAWICVDKKRVDELIQLYLNDEYKIVQRAAWILSHVAEQHHHLVQPYLPQIIHRMMQEDIPVAVKRNGVRMLQYLEIDEAIQGDVMNLCFNFLENANETIAVRCFSMTVLTHLAHLYPEIIPELKTIIASTLELGASAGFISRAKRTMKELATIQQE